MRFSRKHPFNSNQDAVVEVIYNTEISESNKYFIGINTLRVWKFVSKGLLSGRSREYRQICQWETARSRARLSKHNRLREQLASFARPNRLKPHSHKEIWMFRLPELLPPNPCSPTGEKLLLGYLLESAPRAGATGPLRKNARANPGSRRNFSSGLMRRLAEHALRKKQAGEVVARPASAAIRKHAAAKSQPAAF